MAVFSKLFNLMKIHRVQTIKVGVLITAHSFIFMGIPFLFKGSQQIQHIKPEEETKQQKWYSKYQKKFHNLNLQQKYSVFYGGCFSYLLIVGFLTRLKLINQKKLQDLFAMSLRKQIFSQIFIQRERRFNTNILIQKAINDTNMITQSLAESYFTMLRGTFFSIGGTTMILTYFPNLFYITITYAFFFILRNYYMAKKIQQASKDQINHLSSVTKELGEFTENKKSVILSNAENFSNSYFTNSLNINHSKIITLADLRGKQVFFLETFGIGYLLSIICYGTYLIALGQLQAHDLALSLYAIYAAIGIRGLNMGYTDMKEKTGILESLEENIGIDLTQKELYDKTRLFFEQFIKFENYIYEKNENLHLLITLNDDEKIILDDIQSFLKQQRNQTDIQIKNLCYTLVNNNQDIQKKIEYLNISKDKILQIVGRSGTGKTSLFELLLNLRKPDSGEITYLKEDENKEIRIQYFTQVPEIFNRGFVYNVCFGNLQLLEYIFEQNYNQEQVYRVLLYLIQKSLQQANILHKFDQNINQMHKLSAGEKQRLVFARLFFSNPDVIFLDECFANLDPYNQDLIAEKIKLFKKNRTILIISHNQEVLEKIGEKEEFILY